MTPCCLLIALGCVLALSSDTGIKCSESLPSRSDNCFELMRKTRQNAKLASSSRLTMLAGPGVSPLASF